MLESRQRTTRLQCSFKRCIHYTLYQAKQPADGKCMRLGFRTLMACTACDLPSPAGRGLMNSTSNLLQEQKMLGRRVSGSAAGLPRH